MIAKHCPRWSFVTLAALALASCRPESAQATAQSADTFEVKRGKLRISLKENAELAASLETRVRSDMEGQNTVIWLVKEGVRVNKGDKLVELDASQVVEKRASQEIQVARAKASLVSAQKGHEIQVKQNQADLLGADNKLKIANWNQEKFFGRKKAEGGNEMGEREQLKRDALDNIKLAEQEVKLAEDRLLWSKKLNAKDFITKNELDRDQLDFDRKRYQHARASNNLTLLELFDLEIKRLQVEQEVREAELAVDRVRAQGEAKLAQAQAEVESSLAELKLAQERLDNLEAQVKNAVISAPNPGLVVYSFEGDGMRRREVVEEGAQVRQRQTLIILPDITRMVANLSVHEAMVDKVTVGQPALVRIDANSDRIFPARVASVSQLADSSQRSMNPTAKLYKTQVVLDGEDLPLRPNMSASCEIIISEHDDVLFLPVQAVQRQGAVSYAWFATPQGPQARELELGVHDYSYVIVKKGVENGDRAYLTPPPGATAPQFAQPKDPAPAPKAMEAAVRPSEAPASPGEAVVGGDASRGAGAPGAGVPGAGAPGAPGEGRRGRGPGASSPAMTEFRELFKQKRPDLAALVDDMRAMRSNEDVKRAIEEDAELKEKYDALMASFRNMGGGRRGGGEGGRRGGEGGERGGERPATDEQGNK